jgi:glutaredoxin
MFPSTAAGTRTRTPLRSMLLLVALVLGAWLAVQGVQAWSQARLGPRVAALAKPGDIAMIGSTTCVYCAAARAWFEAHHVPYVECLIERDARCAAQYAALLAPGTPVLLVRGKRLLGFDAQAVADALAGG